MTEHPERPFAQAARVALRGIVCLAMVVPALFAGAWSAGVPAPAFGAATTLTPELLNPGDGSTVSEDEQDRYDQLLTSVPEGTREQLQALIAEIEGLDRQLEIAAEEYNYANGRLKTVNEDIAQAQVDYDAISKAYATQSDIVGDRLRAVYKQGVPPEIALLVNAGSVTDLIEVAGYVIESGGSDAELLGRLKQEKTSLEETLTSLRRDKVEAESLQFELKARQIEVGYRVEQREESLKAKSPSLMALLNQTQTAADQDELAIYYKIVEGNVDDLEVETGSPVETALAYRGIPYVWGGSSLRGMDCSGLVLYVFRQHGVTLPHHAASQAKLGTQVTGELEPGDLVFFGSPVHHVGIYIGGGYYIHAPRTGDVVRIAKLSARNDLTAARRFDWQVRLDAVR